MCQVSHFHLNSLIWQGKLEPKRTQTATPLTDYYKQELCHACHPGRVQHEFWQGCTGKGLGVIINNSLISTALCVAAPAKKAVKMLGIIRKGIENKTESICFVFCCGVQLWCAQILTVVCRSGFHIPGRAAEEHRGVTKLMKGKQLSLRTSIAGITHFEQKSSGKDEWSFNIIGAELLFTKSCSTMWHLDLGGDGLKTGESTSYQSNKFEFFCCKSLWMQILSNLRRKLKRQIHGL